MSSPTGFIWISLSIQLIFTCFYCAHVVGSSATVHQQHNYLHNYHHRAHANTGQPKNIDSRAFGGSEWNSASSSTHSNKITNSALDHQPNNHNHYDDHDHPHVNHFIDITRKHSINYNGLLVS